MGKSRRHSIRRSRRRCTRGRIKGGSRCRRKPGPKSRRRRMSYRRRRSQRRRSQRRRSQRRNTIRRRSQRRNTIRRRSRGYRMESETTITCEDTFVKILSKSATNISQIANGVVATYKEWIQKPENAQKDPNRYLEQLVNQFQLITKNIDKATNLAQESIPVLQQRLATGNWGSIAPLPEGKPLFEDCTKFPRAQLVSRLKCKLRNSKMHVQMLSTKFTSLKSQIGILKGTVGMLVKLLYLNKYISYLYDLANWCAWETEETQNKKILSLVQEYAAAKSLRDFSDIDKNILMNVLRRQRVKFIQTGVANENTKFSEVAKKYIVALKKTIKNAQTQSVDRSPLSKSLKCITSLLESYENEQASSQVGTAIAGVKRMYNDTSVRELFKPAISAIKSEIAHLYICVSRYISKMLNDYTPMFKKIATAACKARDKPLADFLTATGREKFVETILSGLQSPNAPQLRMILGELGIDTNQSNKNIADQALESFGDMATVLEKMGKKK